MRESEHGEASGEERQLTTLAHFTVKVETILQCEYGAIERQGYRTTPVPFRRDNSDLVVRPTGSANFSVLYAKAMVTPTSPVGFSLDPVKAFAISSCSCTVAQTARRLPQLRAEHAEPCFLFAYWSSLIAVLPPQFHHPLM
jgi:hypothetical protein